MKKIRPLIVLLFLVAPLRADTPPLDRYGGHYDVTADTATGIHYHFYAEPNINDFEYRAILTDIYTIWQASAPSDCAKLKVVNIILETRVDPYITYPPGVFRSTVPWNPMDIQWISTGTAVSMGLLSTNTLSVDFTVPYSTIAFCNDGDPLPPWLQ